MPRRLLATFLLALLAPAGTPASAAQPPPAGFLGLYDEYRRSGAIGGCAYRAADLRAALAEIPADIEAYDPGFADALSAGLEQRAAGCEEVSSPEPVAAAGIVAADGSPGPAIPRAKQPASAPLRADTSMPVALIALAAVVSLAVLAAAGMEAIRRRRLRR